jgi:hypothetical protein
MKGQGGKQWVLTKQLTKFYRHWMMIFPFRNSEIDKIKLIRIIIIRGRKLKLAAFFF